MLRRKLLREANSGRTSVEGLRVGIDKTCCSLCGVGHSLNHQLPSIAAEADYLDIVHPEIYEGNLENFKRPIERPSLRFCGRVLARWFSNKLNNRSGGRGA